MALTPYDLQAGTGGPAQYSTDLFQDWDTGKIYQKLAASSSARTPLEAVRYELNPPGGDPGWLPDNAFDQFAGSVTYDPNVGWVMEAGAHQAAQNLVFSLPQYQATLKEGGLDKLFEMGPFIAAALGTAGIASGAAFGGAAGAGTEAVGLGGGAFGAGGTAGAGAGAGAGALGGAIGNAPGMGLEGFFQYLSGLAPEAGDVAAADLLGLTQMGEAAGLSGAELQAFVNSGGTLGSTAAGGGGIGTGYLQNMPGSIPDFSGAANEDAALGQYMSQAGAAGGGPGINTPLTTGGASGSSGGFNDFLKSLGMTPGSLLTGLGQGVLGAFGAKSQADAARDAANTQAQALKDVQERYLGLGAPYRDLLGASYKPGFSIWDDAATRDAAGRAADISARGYSHSVGNPFDSPTAQAGIYGDVLKGVALPQLNTYRGQLGTFGQLGTNTAGTAGLGAAQSMGQAAGSGALPGILGALGGGLGTALNPRTSTDELLRLLQGNRFGSGGSLA
jgi:hypothetical protein